MKNTLVVVGVIIILAGLASFASPWFTTHDTKDVANIGDVHITADEKQNHFIPPMVSIGAVVLGAVLIGAAATRRG